MPASISTMLTTANATATGAWFSVNDLTIPVRFQGSLAGTNTVTATLIVEGTNTPDVAASVLTLHTITLSSITAVSDGVLASATWPYVRARFSAISAAAATATMSL